ncbi:DUF1330 domain-containing protein [Roseitranquillus sediminis]|uniref:DUF1330 domain-containing protein n=1 Tax=Roseitranquillus sediminis TaxID=2809051 RepID=UPI001D0CA8A5|nr:DUF1330 domain-containing protein [Roseitranquillus sediminis]MBM9593365.1 DUF1330 domain-containing protein [Roseitranquillus sediminis]
MPKGYWIANITVTNPDAYREYVERDTAIIEGFGGRFLVRGGDVAEREGDVLDRFVVIEFPDHEAALACWNSAEYQEVAEIRRANAESRIVVVEGH